MEEKFTFHKSFAEQISLLPEEDRLDAYKAIMDYAFNNQEYKGDKPLVKIVMANAMPIIRRSRTNSANGKKGGAPVGNQNARKKDALELSDGAREARAAYLRNWRKKNADKVREYEARRWERVAMKIQEELDDGEGR